MKWTATTATRRTGTETRGTGAPTGRATPVIRLAAAMLLTGLLALAPGLRAQHGDHGDHQDHSRHEAMLDAKVEMEQAGDLNIPDLPVLTQDGEKVHFYRDLVAGKVVAMNFIFTTCRTICPPLGANFGKLQQILDDRAGRDVHLISVSVDPVTDTPERLKAWGETFGAGPGWTLVTGNKGDVTRILKALQVFTPDFNDHSPVVLMGNADTGDWTRAYGLAPPGNLAKALEKMAEDPGAGSSESSDEEETTGGMR